MVAALGETKSDEVKEWLATGAFKAAGGDAARLAVAARLAGLLRLEAARGDLEKLVPHPAAPVATAAVEALSQLGVESSPYRHRSRIRGYRGTNAATNSGASAPTSAAT